MATTPYVPHNNAADPDLFHADISALIRCTVPVPTPSVVAILRTPVSPLFNALRIAASVAALVVEPLALGAGSLGAGLHSLPDHRAFELG
jgi:hypothetical protein